MESENMNQEVQEKMSEALKEETKPQPPSIESLRKKRVEEGLSLREALQLNKLEKTAKKIKRNMKAQQEFLTKFYITPREKQQVRLEKKVKVVKSWLHPDDFKMLENIFTVNVPEKKDEKGEVTEKAYSYVNYEGLLLEARNVLVVQREERMKSGKRSRSSGRSSDRKTHKASLKMLLKRNAEESIKEVQANP